MSSGTPSAHAANDGEASRPLSFMASLVRSFVGIERVELEHAQLADRRVLDLLHELAEVERLPSGPGPGHQVGQQDVLGRRQRVGRRCPPSRAGR